MRSVRKELSPRGRTTAISMLSITQTQPYYTPLGQRTDYTVKSSPASTFDVRIIDTWTEEPFAVRRFVDTAEATFDVAPCIRRAIVYAPQNGKTGFSKDRNRSRTIILFAQPAATTEAEAAASRVYSTDKMFYAANDSATPPALLTTMPRARLISPGEQDELSILTAVFPKATVTADNPATGDAEGCNFAISTSGLVQFRIDPEEFPGAERIEVAIEGCEPVVYTVVPPLPEGRRIAWRSSAGSVEHYTFPIEETVTVVAEKTRIYGPDGHGAATTAAETRVRLRSAFEGREVLEALAEILVSPEVWQVDRDGYTPIDVTSDRAVVHRHGTLGCMEVEIRDKRKTPQSWS